VIKLLKITMFLLFIVSSSYCQWIQQTSGTTNVLTNIFFVDASTGIAIGLSGTVRRTTNAGVNWSAQTVVNENLYGIYFINADTGFICGNGGYITRTTNGGSSWQTLSAPVVLYRSITFIDASTGFAAGSGGTIVRTTNAGTNWISLNTGSTDFLQNIKFANSPTGYAAGGDGIILKTSNGGDNWSLLTTGTTELLFGLAVISSDLVYSSGENGKFIKTTNGGSNWTQLTSGIVNRGVNLHFINATTGTAACLNNNILRTTNGGVSWEQQQSGVSGQDWNGVFFTSVLTGFIAGSGGNILFTTTAGFPIPAPPNLLLPANGSNNISITPLLDWDSVTSAKTYQVQLHTDSAYSSPLFDSSAISLTSVNVPNGLLQNNVQYFWRIRSSNAGATGPWSFSSRFRTIVALPTAPNLLLPVNGATNVSLTPTFDWDSTSPADYYTLQASLDTSFTNLQVNITGITQSFLPLSTPLFPNFKYYWRVNATNAAGTGPWSQKFNFITQSGPPAAPILFYPSNGAIGINLTPTLDWIEDYSVTTYQLQLSQDSLFGSTLIDSTGFTASQLTVRSDLLVNVNTYYWRVRTTNALGTGPWSEKWHFLTLLSPPAIPTLVSPPNNSVDITTTPTLDWDSVPYAETYRIQISTDGGFGSFVINSGGLTASQFNVTSGTLNTNTVYFWRVSATNQAGTSPFSAVWNFKTVTSPPVVAPTLLSPPNGAINQPVTLTLDWNDVFNSDGYRIIVAVDSFFNTLKVDTTITASQLTIPNGKLSGDTTYYWRVRGFNTGGFGPWSIHWRFRTGPIGISQIGADIPKSFKLYNNFPNPFNPETNIRFDLPRAEFVIIRIFDITGREVTRLVNQRLEAGAYQTGWDASLYASGIYIYRIETSSFVETKKMVVVK
jgi:photosystem II stability/assembly factor-like uncharacterized protein